MKNVINDLKIYSLYLGMLFFVFSAASCSDDDDGVIEQDPTGNITAEAQVISQNQLVVENVDVEGDAWLVARHGSENGPIIADPFYLEEGSHDNVVLELNNERAQNVDLESGDTIYLTLHSDDDDAVFEEDSDVLMNTTAGTPARRSVEISSPTFSAADQEVENNSVTIEDANIPRGGWIAVYNQDEEGNINEADIVGRTYVEPGATGSVTIPFDEGFTYTPGQNVYTRLHMDDPADQQFTFQDDPSQDRAETFGFAADNFITQGFVVNDQTGTTNE